MKWERNPNWTWRNDLKYWLILPFEVARVVPDILKGYPALNDMTWREYIEVACSFADCKAGRWYRLVEEEAEG